MIRKNKSYDSDVMFCEVRSHFVGYNICYITVGYGTVRYGYYPDKYPGYTKRHPTEHNLDKISSKSHRPTTALASGNTTQDPLPARCPRPPQGQVDRWATSTADVAKQGFPVYLRQAAWFS